MSETITEKETVEEFLLQHKNKWTFFNVPFEDGQALENLVLENNSQTILEIGTSTGHSTIWLAKAVEKTGGKIITIEIDKNRHQQALKNFKEADVSHLIEAKLGDALQIIPTLNETFDFVFSDATLTVQPKESYLLFFKATEPKLKIGGLYTMHNVTDGYGDDGRFFKYLEKLGNYQTSIIRASHNGISVSKKLK
ncbi:Predicted O-methyltransferase YrrM [Halpernia frigidisoli]|uniref:Predicted O-methyltransferase YrrM n=2 Tax=Halpernia frigidisoli TaxID=1125876 RepID=A0A1I3F0E5_9FLAO|nr:Predicted O-methyltransferase YrrM [Halpernia frigidisoli]